MPMNFTPSSRSASAPKFEDATYTGRFEGVVAKELEKSTYDPEVFIWSFTILDEDGKAVYFEGAEDPWEVEKVTSRSMNLKSKTTPGAVKVLKALCTDEEWDEFEKQAEMEEEDRLAYIEKHPDRVLKDEDLIGRKVDLDLVHKENGWPDIESIRRKRTRKS